MMGTGQGEFFDYYEFLDLPPEATHDEIRNAVALWRDRNNRERTDPTRFLQIDWREARLTEIERILLDSQRRAAYGLLHNHMAAAGNTTLLWLDPGFEFYADDPEPALTLPSLARKLDSNWALSQQAILNKAIEGMVFYVARNPKFSSQRPRYEALQKEIGRLRETLGKQHPDQMLESVIVLCDNRIQRPSGYVDAQPLESSAQPVNGKAPPSILFSPVEGRPDRPLQAQFQLEYASEGRGCLFGYCWVQEGWGAIMSPPVEDAVAAGDRRKVVHFELMRGQKIIVKLQMEATALLKLERPQTHYLPIAFELQPETAQRQGVYAALPVALTKIPAKAIFDPAFLTLPVVRHGSQTTGSTQLRNQGEAPLNARLVGQSDSAVTVEETLGEMGGEIRVTVDTRDLPRGKTFRKWVRYAAEGDAEQPMLDVEGELLPSAWQHVFREQPLRDRLTLASSVALCALLLGPLALGALSPVVFWVICGLLMIGAALGAARLIALSSVRHIRASGDTLIRETSIPWQPLLIGVGISTGVLALIVGLLAVDDSTKSATYAILLALLFAITGFFLKEDLVIYPRPMQASTSVVQHTTPKVQTGWRILLVLGGLVVGVIALVFASQFITALLPVIVVLLIVLLLVGLFA
jgi:hypothetical protein